MFDCGGIQIFVANEALAETEVRNFPESKHRSKRIRKKLIKRFGGEFRKEPCSYQVGNRIYAHPAIYAELKRNIPERNHGAAVTKETER